MQLVSYWENSYMFVQITIYVCPAIDGYIQGGGGLVIVDQK